MKLTLVTVLSLTIAVVVRSQQQPPKAEPVPHSEQHSPGNPPSPAGSPPASPNANNSSIGGNTLTNVAVPKAENAPKAEPPSAPGETKPKAEPPADHDHDHDHDHEHSPGNPKHLDHMGGGAGGVRATQFMLIIAAIAPFALTILASSL